MTLSADTKKRQLVVIRSTPYGSTMAKSSLDTALAFAAFDRPIDVLFLGKGVLQLVSTQDGKAIDSKTIGKQIASFPLYGIEHYYADEEALRRFSLDANDLPPQVSALNKENIRELIASHDHVLGF
ncbi:MAG: tRNA 2-thiouridine synthesizing protein C [Halioglobus sp.]